MTKKSKCTKELSEALDDRGREMRLEFRSLNEGVKYCSDSGDRVKSLTTGVKELRKEAQLLIRINQVLQAENKNLADKIEELEHYQRSNNLEIKGVPMEADPLIAQMLIGEKLGKPFNETGIDICHEVPTRRATQKNVIMFIVQRNKRNAVLAKSR